MKLASKTILLLTAIVSTVMVSVGFLLLHYQEESFKKSISDGLEGQTRMAAFGIENVIGEGLKEAEAIAASFPALAFQMEDIAQVESYLQRMFETNPIFGNGFFVLGLNGGFFADYPSHPQLRGESFADREYYQRAIQEGRGVISKPYRSRHTGQLVLTFTTLIRNVQGQVVAILGCSLDLLSKQVLGGYRMQQFGKTGYLYIFDKSRLLVLHPDDKRLLTHVEPDSNRLLEDALSGFEGSGETVSSQGIPMLLSVTRVPVTDWIVAVQVPQAEAYAPVARTRLRFFLLAGGALALVVFVGSLTIRFVTRPLRQLESLAMRISADLAGAEEKRVFAADSVLEGLERIRAGDEIGQLASAFSRLVMTLNQALGSLQRSADDWQRIFDSVNEGIVTLDGEGRITRMNSAAEDKFRTTNRKVGGQYAYRVIFGTATPPPDWPDISSLEA